MDNELYHHGVKGQKWGVRRFQNKDGSLTLAGKKRALKMQNQYTKLSDDKRYRDKHGNLTYAGRKKELKMKEKYSELTGKDLRRFTPRTNKSTADKSQRISEMTNAEIQARIDRIRLENTLKSLTPAQTSKGEKFINDLKDTALSMIKDKGTRLIGDYIDKQLRDKLGLNTKNTAESLQKKAQEYENRLKIDKAQQYFKEGKYANKSSSQNNSNQTKGQNSSDSDDSSAADKAKESKREAKTEERKAKAEEHQARAEEREAKTEERKAKAAERQARTEERKANTAERKAKVEEPKYTVTGEGSSSRTSSNSSSKEKSKPDVINLTNMGNDIYGYDPEVEKRIRALLGSGR